MNKAFFDELVDEVMELNAHDLHALVLAVADKIKDASLDSGDQALKSAAMHMRFAADDLNKRRDA